MAAENFKVKKGLEVGTAITATSSGINVTGIITATQLVGDGSGLTGVVGSGSGVVVKDEGSAVGTAGTINFVGSGVAATLSAGTATVTINAGGLDNVVEDTTPQLGGNLDLNSKFVTGSGGINVTGVVTATTLKGNGDFVDIDVDGQTELDNVSIAGVTTFAQTIRCNSSSTSVFTGGIDFSQANVTSGNITFVNNRGVLFGSGNPFQIYHNSGASIIEHNGTGTLNIMSKSSDYAMRAYRDGGVKLYFAGNEKLTTTINGIEVPDLNVTGVGTVGRLETSGVTLGTNSTTFAAKFADDAVINVGTNNDLRIYHDDGNGLSYIRQDGTGPLDIRSINDINIRDGNDGDLFIKCEESEGVRLYYEGSEKLITDQAGIKVTGVCTATSFSGDGSGLTGITASGSGILVKHDGNNVGTAGTINFSTNLDVSAISAGIVTVTASGGGGDKIEEGDTKVETVDSGDAADAYVTTEVNGTEEIRTIGGQTTIKYLRVGSAWNMANSTGTGIALSYSNTHDIIKGNSNGGLDILHSTSVELGQNGSPNYKYAEFRNTQGLFRTNNVERFRYDALGIRVGNNAVSTGATIGVDGSATFAGIVTATTFSGALASSNLTGALPAISGANLTSLNASELDSGTIPNGRFPATLPTVSGANLTALNASEITSGTLPIARIADDAVTFAKIENVGTSRIIGRTSSGTGNIETLTAATVRTLLNVEDGANVGITTAPSNIVATWNVVNQSASAYRFTGPGQDGSSNNPDIYLVRGNKYRFALNAGGHPFQIRVSNGGSAYNDGVTNNGAQTGNIEFYVQNDAPASLVYQCTAHSGMVGNIYITGHQLTNGADNRVVTATSAYGMTGESNLTFDGTHLVVSPTSASNTIRTKIRASSANDDARLGIYYGNTEIAALFGKWSGSAFSTGLNIPYEPFVVNGASGAERLRINASGQVSIGGNSTVNTKLHVENSSGDAHIRVRGSVNYGVLFTRHSDGALTGFVGSGGAVNLGGSNLAVSASLSGGDIVFQTGGTASSNERLRIESGGDIKLSNADSIIHTSANTSRLRLFGGSSNSVSNGAALTLHGVSHSSGNYADLAAGTGGRIQFRIGTSEKLHITSGGNVNIGGEFTQTSRTLAVVGSALFKNTEADIWLHSTGANKIWRILGSTGGSTHQFRIYDESNSSDRLKIGNTGRVDVPEVYGTAISSPMRDLYIESTGQLGYNPSVRASKINIADNNDVSWLYNLTPKTYNKRKRVCQETNEWTNEAESDLQYGLIAEEVESVNSNICFYDVDDSNNKTLAGVTYSQLITPLLKALQEQKAEIDALKTRVATLES